MIYQVSSQNFFKQAHDVPIIDVRAPQEYIHAHIPGAHNVPLFSDQARAQVGLLYKQEGKHAAIKLGLSIVGPRLLELVKHIEAIAPQKIVRMHCWRGGMRSQSLAWLLNMSGFNVYLLEGGYKQYRAYMREQFAKKFNLISIGGKTGSGKTDFLKTLASLDYSVIDIENLANHKGSVFGHVGSQEQPSQEQFENLLGLALLNHDSSKPLFVEKESRRIGKLLLPEDFFKQLQTAPSVSIQASKQERIQRIMRDYGMADKRDLCNAVKKIEKHLGGLACKTISNQILENNYDSAISSLLNYYDAYYGEQENITQYTILDPAIADSTEIKKFITRFLENLCI